MFCWTASMITESSSYCLCCRVRDGKRPQLPPNCPNYLSGLIQQCWDGNPVNRPDFQTICTELRYIKGRLLTGMVFHHCILSIQVNWVLVANVTCTIMPCMYWGVLGLVVRLFLPLIPACRVTFVRLLLLNRSLFFFEYCCLVPYLLILLHLNLSNLKAWTTISLCNLKAWGTISLSNPSKSDWTLHWGKRSFCTYYFEWDTTFK
jgi:hypothetical protein